MFSTGVCWSVGADKRRGEITPPPHPTPFFTWLICLIHSLSVVCHLLCRRSVMPPPPQERGFTPEVRESGHLTLVLFVLLSTSSSSSSSSLQNKPLCSVQGPEVMERKRKSENNSPHHTNGLWGRGCELMSWRQTNKKIEKKNQS